jgi:tRNA1Val (adenine37-N6)-methyltransferase
MDFQFKQFSIQQDQCAFKVGTDSVLLGSWVNPEQTKNILDIGTGSGILALMMAQKTAAASITAIDIDEGAFLQAKLNFESSPWKDRIQIIHSSLQEHAANRSTQYDLIISNPPYFINKAHAKDSALSIARNTQTLPFEELLKAAHALLLESGKLCVVLPTPEAKLFRKFAENQGFVLSKLLRIQTKPGDSYEKRHLMQFEKTAFYYQEEILVIEGEEHFQYSEEYKNLTKDFYLAF